MISNIIIPDFVLVKQGLQVTNSLLFLFELVLCLFAFDSHLLKVRGESSNFDLLLAEFIFHAIVLFQFVQQSFIVLFKLVHLRVGP
jgi:hypothetical protein